jgi:hypothetical protein
MIIFEANPEATKVQNNDDYGSLPLHDALRYKASNDVIKMLLNANPEATKVQDIRCV